VLGGKCQKIYTRTAFLHGRFQTYLNDIFSKRGREALGTASVPVPFHGGEGAAAASSTAAQSTAFGEQVIFSSLCLCILIHCLPCANCFFGNAVVGIIEMQELKNNPRKKGINFIPSPFVGWTGLQSDPGSQAKERYPYDFSIQICVLWSHMIVYFKGRSLGVL